jgi:DNA-binding Lrp family transcriptional regulator
MLIELTRDNRRTTLEEIAERVDVDPSTLRKSRRYARFREVWRGYKAKAPGKSDDSAE